MPVLITAQQEIIEESLEIMQYAKNWVLNEEEKYWVMRNDDEFNSILTDISMQIDMNNLMPNIIEKWHQNILKI